MEIFNSLFVHTIKCGKSTSEETKHVGASNKHEETGFQNIQPISGATFIQTLATLSLLLCSPWERHSRLPGGAELKESAFPTPSGNHRPRPPESD
jgi:hypothetical protein